jgi:uncharacterized YigZ family protein
MVPAYRTFKEAGVKEIVIKKSRFIGYGFAVSSEEEANQQIERIRKEHWNATHNCFAYVIGDRDQIQKQSDDGEPSGTAGKPILEVIKAKELHNVLIIVTRYFGGIMLGAGGLIRAYSDGAVAAIEASSAVLKQLHSVVEVEVDYTWLGKLENELRNRQVLTGETQFADNVKLSCLPVVAETDAFVAWMTDVTQGQGKIEVVETKWIEHKIEGASH